MVKDGKKQLAEDIRTTVNELNKLLGKAKDLNLTVVIYPLTEPDKTVRESSQLRVSDIHEDINY